MSTKEGELIENPFYVPDDYEVFNLNEEKRFLKWKRKKKKLKSKKELKIKIWKFGRRVLKTKGCTQLENLKKCVS